MCYAHRRPYLSYGIETALLLAVRTQNAVRGKVKSTVYAVIAAGVDDDYRIYDLQERFVMHPWERFRGTDTKHYPDYNYVVNSTIYDRDIYFPTEFMHGIFDGGAAASLSDFWDVMMKHRAPAGGFLWALLDEGLLLPATQLVDNQQSYRIAYLKKLFVRRIMRHPHRIHVHLFYKAGIAKRYVARQRTATLRPETMTVDTLENNTASV